jgi:flagellar biosynthesis protein FlhB
MSYTEQKNVVLTALPTDDAFKAGSQELATNLRWLDQYRLSKDMSKHALDSLGRVGVFCLSKSVTVASAAIHTEWRFTTQDVRRKLSRLNPYVSS